MSVQLPELFEQKLKGNDREIGIVFSALDSFGKWFESSGTPPFFRDYTDHGIKHIVNVLSTTAALIPPEAAEVLTASDVTIFVLATLLHDSALHLAEPGFEQLIIGKAKDRVISAFDQSAWPALWEQFLFVAHRWDDRKLAAVFGEEFRKQKSAVRDPLDHWGNLSLTDYKLIGEFIRLYHPRLAHEFAVFGVPGVEPEFLRLPETVSAEWLDLSGVIARSHGVPLRSCLDYVKDNYHIREYQGIHAIYLMALLRMADYIQIEAARAPDIVFHYRVLPSLVSAMEWRAHNAVKNITPQHEDPESVEVQAEPPDVETYLRLKDWLDGIQSELDISWAVLGEVYGRYSELKTLGLNWRRVRSNLDVHADFANTVSYLPRRIRVEVARAEMLSLLIRPLYGDEPSYGVRELIQNAVDAVREREYFQKHFPGCSQEQVRNQPADVVVRLSDFDREADCAWLEVTDRGIGMTESTLVDYFLKAGASYRHSEEWQHIFERADLPADEGRHRSNILRSGRFGIGALATFLIGTEIEVETRHITSAEGFRFKMFLTQDAVQVERFRGVPIGTSIRVKVDGKVFKQLSRKKEIVSIPNHWDWYVLRTPSVLRTRGETRAEIVTQFDIDLCDWHELNADLPFTVHWSFDRRAPHLSCNGIFVSNSFNLPKLSKEERYSRELILDTPRIHISDPDGYFPLGLTRKDLLEEEYGFESALAEDVAKDYFAHFLSHFPEEPGSFEGLDVLRQSNFSHIVSFGSTSNRLPCFLSSQGFCLPSRNALGTVRKPLRNVLFLSGADAIRGLPSLSNWDCVVVNGTGDFYPQSFDLTKDGVRFSNLYYRQETEKDTRPLVMDFRVARISAGPYSNGDRFNFIPENLTRKQLGKRLPISERALSVRNGRTKKKIWLVETESMPEGSAYPFDKLVDDFMDGVNNRYSFDFTFEAEVSEIKFQEPWVPGLEGFSLIDEWWQRLFGKALIPWRKVDRKRKLAKAYKELAPYISRYEK